MNKRSEQTIAIALTIFIFSSISASLIIPMGESKTIILQTPSGTDSCVVDFVLAQNLTDLCDVVIINPSTNQIIEYNGTQWVNVNSTTFSDTTVCNNLGTGAIVCAGGNVNLRTILGSSDISVVQGANEITIDYNGTLISDDTVCANVGFGAQVFKDGECNFRTLLGGSNIIVTQGADAIAIGVTGITSESTVCNNVGTGNQLCSGGNVNIDTLIAGTGITITDTTDDWTFDNTGVISNSCSAGISCSGTNPSSFTVAWEQLCNQSLGSPATVITCSSFTARKYLHIEVYGAVDSGTSGQWGWQFNSDSGNNYGTKVSRDGSADTTQSSATSCRPDGATNTPSNNNINYVMDINNFSAEHNKLGVGQGTLRADGAQPNLPTKIEFTCLWSDTSAQITTVDFTRITGAENLITGSGMTIWGHD